MEFKGTKGQFKDGKLGWKIKNVTTNGVSGYEVIYSDKEECITDHVYTIEDANLIANAPELLSVCIKIKENIKQGIVNQTTINTLEDVINSCLGL